jgi:fructokinase
MQRAPSRQSVVLCLGEALVDFYAGTNSEQPWREEGSSTESFGGSQANVAVGAARFGAQTALLGAAGKDAWGRWLREQLAQAGVDVSWFELHEGIETPQAIITLDREGEPSFAFRGEDDAWAIGAAGKLEQALASIRPAVVSFGSDTLVGPRARELTMKARRLALRSGALLVYDPNLRERRWPATGEMLIAARAAIPDCTVVKANREEAQALTGRETASEATTSLLERGAHAAVVTLGAEGALVSQGAAEPVHVPGRSAVVVDVTGAGDAVAAVLAAALAASDNAPLVPVTALAMEVAARICSVRGAIAGLSAPADARAALDRALSLQ